MMVLDDSAAVVERVDYSAYGTPRHHYRADLDGDGDVDSTDLSTINTLAGGRGTAIEDPGYIAYADLDRDGDIDSTDYNIASTEGTYVALAEGVLTDSSVDNIFGYSGYLYNPTTKLYCLRLRWYSTDLGRFIERDPMGYVDGMNQYQYVESMPLVGVDPYGLQRRPIPEETKRAPGPRFSEGDFVVRIFLSEEEWDEFARANPAVQRVPAPGLSPEAHKADQQNNDAELKRVRAGVTLAAADVSEFIVWEVVAALTGGQIVHIAGGVFRIVRISDDTVKLVEVTAASGKLSKNVSGGRATADQILEAAIRWLDEGYEEIAPGVFRSADGKRQFRMVSDDLAKGHVHFEYIADDGRAILENCHVELNGR